MVGPLALAMALRLGHMPRTATIRKFIKRQHGTEPNKLVSRQLPAPRPQDQDQLYIRVQLRFQSGHAANG